MKLCPKCNRTYRDDMLRFCLEDGNALAAVGRSPSDEPTRPSGPGTRDSDPPPTEIMHERGSPTLKVAGPTQSSYDARAEPRAASPVSRNADEMSTPETRSATPPKITASASSVRLAVQSNTYYAANAIDGKRSTAWIEGVDGPGIGEWIRFDFDREIVIHRILIQPGYFKSPQIWAGNNRLAVVTAQFSDGSSRELTFADSMTSQKVDVGAIRTKWVRFVIKSVYYGTDPDTALSEVAFEWES